MKSLLTLTLLGLCLIAAAPPSPAQTIQGPLKKKFQKAGLMPFYDGAKDETAVYMFPVGLKGSWGLTEFGIAWVANTPVEGVRLTVYFTYPGRTYAPPRQVTLRLMSVKRSEPEFTGAEVEHALLADGERLVAGRTAVESNRFRADTPKPGTEYVGQILDIPLTVEEFGRLVAAKRAEVVVAGRGWPLKGEHLKALQRVADAIAAGK